MIVENDNNLCLLYIGRVQASIPSIHNVINIVVGHLQNEFVFCLVNLVNNRFHKDKTSLQR